MKQEKISNQSVDDIEKSWKDKVVALEKVNEVLRNQINELQNEAQSTTEVLNQARNKLQECKANEMNVQKELTVKIIGLEKEIDHYKAVDLKLRKTLQETEIKYAEESKLQSSSMVKIKEFKHKLADQQLEINSLKHTSKIKEATNVSARERQLTDYKNLQTKFQEQRKAYEQTSNQNSDLESKLSDKTKALEQSRKETASLKGNITKIKNKNRESEEIIEQIWNQIKDEGINLILFVYDGKFNVKKLMMKIIPKGKK